MGLLTRKALAAYAGLSGDKAASYSEVKAEVLHHLRLVKKPIDVGFAPTARRQRNRTRTGVADFRTTSPSGYTHKV